jgi:hypothetical protein
LTTHHNTRNDDYATSVEGAADVAKRSPNQRTRLLSAFFYADEKGLTDEEAAQACGLLASCYWKRCGELRADNFIAFTGETRVGQSGISRNISVITQHGKFAIHYGEPV